MCRDLCQEAGAPHRAVPEHLSISRKRSLSGALPRRHGPDVLCLHEDRRWGWNQDGFCGGEASKGSTGALLLTSRLSKALRHQQLSHRLQEGKLRPREAEEGQSWQGP